MCTQKGARSGFHRPESRNGPVLSHKQTLTLCHQSSSIRTDFSIECNLNDHGLSHTQFQTDSPPNAQHHDTNRSPNQLHSLCTMQRIQTSQSEKQLNSSDSTQKITKQKGNAIHSTCTHEIAFTQNNGCTLKRTYFQTKCTMNGQSMEI